MIKDRRADEWWCSQGASGCNWQLDKTFCAGSPPERAFIMPIIIVQYPRNFTWPLQVLIRQAYLLHKFGWRVKGTSLHLSGWASNIPRRWEHCVCETESTWRIIQRIIKWPSHSEWIWEVFRILLFGIRIFRHVLHVITVLIKLVPFTVHKAGTIPITDVMEVKCVPCIVQSRPECLWGGIFERQGVLLEARGAAGDMCCALIKPLEVMHLQPKKSIFSLVENHSAFYHDQWP